MHAPRRTAIVALTCLILTLTVLVVGAAASTPMPPPPPPIQFGVETAAFDWSDIKDGEASIPVWNNTLEPLSMTVSLSPMGFVEVTEQDGALENQEVLQWEEELPLPAGRQASIPLSPADKTPKAGSYSGVLHVSVADPQVVIHLDLTITVSSADAGTGAVPVPLVKEWNLFQYRCPLFGWACPHLRNRFLPLDVKVGEDPELPKIALEDGAILGYLTSPDKGLAKVSVEDTDPEQQEFYEKYAIKLAVDETLRILPSLRLTKSDKNNLVRAVNATTLRLIIAKSCSQSRSWNLPRPPKPALLIR